MSSLPQESSDLQGKPELYLLMQEQLKRKKENLLKSVYPETGPLNRSLYPKSMEFFRLGRTHRERLVLGGNRTGKTFGTGGYEFALHATGLYPPWWQGRVFEFSTRMWAVGTTARKVRDTIQRILCGPVGELGHGLIPKSSIIGTPTRKHGVPDAYDQVRVKRANGYNSLITFKSFDQGREAFEGDELDVIWLDEEAPAEVYNECLIRTMTTDGIIFLTFTPMEGLTEMVEQFLPMGKFPDYDPGKSKAMVNITWDDAPHLDDEAKAELLEEIPAHMREARTKGVPALGSGKVFPIPEEELMIEAFEIPSYWARLGGLDFGWDHPFAAVELAWDRDADQVFVINEFRMSQATPLIHAEHIKRWGFPTMPWAWPHDGQQHSKGDGQQLARLYSAHGLTMLPDFARFIDGSYGREAGIQLMLEYMETGRLKVFSHLSQWFEEFRLYHRKNGKIVATREDLLSATRYGMMCLRFGIPVPQEREERLEILI